MELRLKRKWHWLAAGTLTLGLAVFASSENVKADDYRGCTRGESCSESLGGVCDFIDGSGGGACVCDGFEGTFGTCNCSTGQYWPCIVIVT